MEIFGQRFRKTLFRRRYSSSFSRGYNVPRVKESDINNDEKIKKVAKRELKIFSMLLVMNVNYHAVYTRNLWVRPLRKI